METLNKAVLSILKFMRLLLLDMSGYLATIERDIELHLDDMTSKQNSRSDNAN